MTFLSNLMGKAVGDIDSILATFHKATAKLDLRAAYHAEQDKWHATEAKAHEALQQEHAALSVKASSIASKIKALVS